MSTTLNDEQQSAVLHHEGPLMIVAGAGTGKTKTLTHRIAHLIHHHHVAPASILAITFTNKAANEMRERIIELLHISAEETRMQNEVPFMGTFHSLGVFILRHHGERVGIKKNFAILDTQDQTSIIKQAFEKASISTELWDPKTIRGRISYAKNNLLTPDTLAHQARSEKDAVTAQVWRYYENIMRESNALDFDDLLVETWKLLDGYADIRAYYQNKWQYIHVDEYQDTNTVQYNITKLLVGDRYNICVVGDTDQNIYSWRGADFTNMLRFEKDYPDATIIILKKNYRSTKNILDVADEIISKNKNRIIKELVSTKHDGSPIKIFTGMTGADEAYFIAREAKRLIEEGIEPKDIAVLYRTNFQSRALEEAFVRENVPYFVLGVKFFDRKEVKDILAYIRAAHNRSSFPDIARTLNYPKRGLGKTSITHILAGDIHLLKGGAQSQYQEYNKILEQIYEYSLHHGPDEIITFALRTSGIEQELLSGNEEDRERLMNIQELVSFATRYRELAHNERLDAFLSDIALMSDQDTDAQGKNGVKLMTIHASKGLEFHTVFIAGLEQGIFPGTRNDSTSDTEEERRLMYVAVTRAQHTLYVTHAYTRRIFGDEVMYPPSEFLLDIPDESKEHIDHYGTRASSANDLPTVYLDF